LRANIGRGHGMLGVMKRPIFLFGLSGSIAIAAACSTSPTTDDGGTQDATNDVTQQDSSNKDSSTQDSAKDVAADTTSDTGSTDAGSDGDGAVQLTLTINDYISWCSVTVNGGTPSTGNPQTYMFAPNTMVTVHGDTANSSAFYWGYWGNVAPDGGLADGGEDLGKTVSFTITRDMTLNACCPDLNQPLTQCTF
jgi:hypothetical protein